MFNDQFILRKMIKNEFIKKTEEFVKIKLKDFDSAHNWWHIERVRKSAFYINSTENLTDPFTIDLSALMHDVADSKFVGDNEPDGYIVAETFLKGIGIDKNVIGKVIFVMKNISFSLGDKQTGEMTPELKVVQDADRLDAMGAIGIARAFNYGGFRNREIYIPEESPKLYMKKAEYKKSFPSTINHFYDKLLLLKDLMNTKTGRELAEERHKFMELFLDEFYKEWENK
jgi:uncharacterized protein